MKPLRLDRHYQRMLEIRLFESLVLEAFARGHITGTTHTCAGQEAVAVAAASGLGDGDIVVSNHRSHGHFLARTGEFEGLFAEIMGLESGVCRGLGGSQHLCHGDFFSNGIQGGIVPVSTGIALAEKVKGTGNIAVCFLGDGTLGEGAVYEAFNMASLWNAPVLFVVENNRIAQTTPIERHLAGNIADRPRAFGIRTSETESSDVAELISCFGEAISHVRGPGGPFCQIVHTQRLGPHSKGDDTRDPSEIEDLRRNDPLVLGRRHFSEQQLADMERSAQDALAGCRQLLERKEQGRLPDRTTRPALDADLVPGSFEQADGWITEPAEGWLVTLQREALGQLMGEDPRIHLIGEDLADPYGGAFKVTKGLSTAFPDRVWTSPISEAGIAGLANGMALRGLKPIVEIMFGDFTALAMDQILNHAAKFGRMYAGQASCPVIIRAPMGGYRGYGPTHSQCLEKFVFGVPGLVVTAASPVHDPLLLWRRMLVLETPCFHVENKILYAQAAMTWKNGSVGAFKVRSSHEYFPTLSFCLRGFEASPDVTIFAYGGMVPMALEAARELFVEDEITVEVVVPSQLSPLPEAGLLDAARRSGRVLTLEEGTKRQGWGAEVGAYLLESGAVPGLTLSRIAAFDTIVPNCPQAELGVLPDLASVVTTARRLAHDR